MNALVYRNPYRSQRFMRNHEESKGECRFSPRTNIMESDENFRIELAVPGFDKKEIKIDLEKEMLKVFSERENGNSEKEYRVKEFGNHNFCKTFVIPESVDTENIKAEYTNGILALTLPKKEEVRVKKQIQVS